MAKQSRRTQSQRAVDPAAAGRAGRTRRQPVPSLPVEPWWGRPLPAAMVVAALAVVAYARSLGNAFTYDEGLVIIEAQRFLRSGQFGVLFSKHYFGATLEGTWRPACTFTYMLDAMVALHPATFRAQSLLWHVGTALLVAKLARRLLPEAHRRWAIVAALLFALHPVTTETVDNPSFREDSLAAFFTVATVLLALSDRPLAALATYVVALLSKESAIVAPALLAIIRLARVGPTPAERRSASAIAAELVPYLLLTAAYLGVRFGPMKTPIAYARYPGGSLAGTLLWMPAVWAHDLRLLVWPWPLCADYTGYFPFGQRPTARLLPAVLLVVAFVAAVVVAARRRQALVAVGLAWFALSLVPVSNLIPVPIPAAERFLYLPLIGIALAAAAGVGALSARWTPGAARALGAAGAAAVAACLLLVNLRHAAWRDDAALWADTARVNPRSCGAQSAVGGGLLSRGMASGSEALLREAVSRQELALRLCSETSDAMRTAMTYTRLGAAHALLKELGPAQAALERATELAPNYGLPVVWLGYVRFVAGDPQHAAELLKRAVIDLGPPSAAVAEVAQLYLDKV